jgi:D-alanyl-D-alanine carboxypeptidase/D-alanyl-D-alanine-endopeptidase (penicillin-binding protein 4)
MRLVDFAFRLDWIAPLCGFALLLQAPSVLARETTQLPPAVNSALEQNGIPTKDLSVFVQDARTDEILMAHNSDMPRQPASTIKVLTSIVALDTLGPAYTWTTRAYTTAPVKQGVLDGDLVIVGGGDPYMVAERWWSFVMQLRQTGLTVINGDILIDRSFFAPLPEDRGSFDSQPERSYNVVPDALMVNFQTATFSIGSGYVAPGSPNKFASVSVDPMPANLDLNNNVRLGNGGCRRAQQGLRFDTPQGASGNALVIRGVVPRNCGRYSTSRAIMSAPDFAYGTFRTLWEQSGGSIKGKLRLATLPPKSQLLFEYNSLTLAEVVRLLNKFSNNVMARHLFLTLGAEKFGAPATTDNGRRAIMGWLGEQHIDIPGLVLDNGSGLSRDERISARGLAQVLRAGWHSQYMPEFVAALPLAGADGTLRNRFNAPAMHGRIRMKTGHLDDVTSLAGYINAVSGNSYIAVIVVNHPGAIFGSGDDVQAAVLRWVFSQ